MAKDFIFPPSSRYTCQSCGRCCIHWAIKVENAVAEKLLAYDWGAHYPDMKGIDLFVHKDTGITEGKSYFMKMRKNGRCPFLEENNFCRIHSDLGYDAKPAECKLFPLSFSEGPRGIHTRMSYHCPSVASNEGKALSAQTRWIAQCYRQSGAQSLGETYFLAENSPIKWSDLLLIEGNLLRIMKQESPQSIRERLLLGGTLIEALISQTTEGDGARIGNYLRDVEKLSYEPVLAGINAPAPSPLRGRLALALFLFQDSSPTMRARLVRMPAMVRFLLKFGSLKSHVLGTKTTLSKMGKVEFSIGPESTEFLTRFFEQKIVGKRYIDGDPSIEAGWALLCAAYELIEIYSRFKAASENRDAVSHSDIMTATGITDLLAVEHTVFFQLDVTRRLIQVVLKQPGMYRNVLGAL